jgi:muramoyltetrapeptide carboxypeptidase
MVSLIVPNRLRPPALRAGGTIRVVAPASVPLFPHMRLREGVESLRRRGYRVELGRTLREALRHGIFSAPDEVRADELNDAFRDPSVDAVFCARGGVGSLRLLERLEYDVVAAHPKPFVGFSDITACQMAFFSRTGLVSFQGPMVAVFPDAEDTAASRRIYERTWDLVFRLIAEGDALTLENPYDSPDPKTLRGGSAQGTLVGGNLTLFHALQGTPFDVPTRDRILFLEDVNTSAYQIEDAVTSLGLAGKVREARAVVFGELLEPKERESPEPSLEEATAEALAHSGLSGPAFVNFASGHGRYFLPLPMGADVRVDADLGSIALLESAVER